GRPFEIESEVLKLSGGMFQETTLLQNDRGRVRLLHEGRFFKKVRSPSESLYVDTSAPVDTTMLFRLYDLETNLRANLFKKYLGSWDYYTFDPLSLRSRQARPMDNVLLSTGENLSSVLYTLHNEKPRIEKKLIDA